jgi:signal transduction histidine kinase
MSLTASPEQPHPDVTAPHAVPETGRYQAEPGRGRDELRVALAIGRALSGALDLDRVLAVTVSAVAKIIGAEGSSILLIDPDTGGMSFHVAAGPGAEATKTVPLPPGAGICGHVARTGQPLVVNDAQHDPRLYRQVDRTTGIVTRNILCVPLRCGQRMWGVLELINKRREADFDARDLRLTEAVGAQVALALDNAHLHAEIVRQTRMAAVGRTVSGLAHCVKNVLNGIRSGSAVVDRCLKANEFEKVRQGWEVVRKNNDMLGNLVLDMLSLARDTKFHPFPTDVNDLADQLCGLMAPRAAERGIRLECTPQDGLKEVMTDPTQLYRCLLNLISNAIDACADGGRVGVRVFRGRGRDRFTVSVSDDGAGIAPENRHRLFAEFFTTKGSRGTGLGLPVTKKLIEGMGGRIVFHSVVGRGTKFVAALPAEEPPEPGKEDRP